MGGTSFSWAGCLNSLGYLGRAQLTCALRLFALKSNSHLERVVLQTSFAYCVLQVRKFLWSICTTMLSAFHSSQPASELEKWGKTVSLRWISLVTADSSLTSFHLFMKFLTLAWYNWSFMLCFSWVRAMRTFVTMLLPSEGIFPHLARSDKLWAPLWDSDKIT